MSVCVLMAACVLLAAASLHGWASTPQQASSGGCCQSSPQRWPHQATCLPHGEAGPCPGLFHFNLVPCLIRPFHGKTIPWEDWVPCLGSGLCGQAQLCWMHGAC